MNIRQAWLGQVLAFALAVGVSAGGFYLVMSGKDASGVAAIIGSLAGLVSVFILGRRSQERERADARGDLKRPGPGYPPD